MAHDATSCVGSREELIGSFREKLTAVLADGWNRAWDLSCLATMVQWGWLKARRATAAPQAVSDLQWWLRRLDEALNGAGL